MVTRSGNELAAWLCRKKVKKRLCRPKRRDN